MTTAQAMTTMTGQKTTGQKTTGRATMMATEMVRTTEMMTRVMDESIAPGRRSGGVTARSRIVGWLLLLAAVALAANLAISARVLLSQVGDRIDAELAHEADKARDWIARERDPVTNAAFSSVTELFRRYLETTLPEEGETYFSVVAGDAAHRARADTSSQGTGLGLAIVKSIAEAHDGRVLVDSRIGRGARFTLEIPLVTPAARRSDSATPALIPVPSEAPR